MTPRASELHIACYTLVASCRDLLSLNIKEVEYVAMVKANLDPTKHSCMAQTIGPVCRHLSNRLSQVPHLINLVGFLSQHIQEDLQLAMAKKEGDIAIFVELVEELTEEDCGPH